MTRPGVTTPGSLTIPRGSDRGTIRPNQLSLSRQGLDSAGPSGLGLASSLVHDSSALLGVLSHVILHDPG